MIVLSVLFPFLGQTSTKSNGDKRPDRIIIQLGTGLSKNEMPAVGFLHDLHTKAVDGKCVSCHVEKDNAFVFKFKRTDEKVSMDFYHEKCIACHSEKKPAGDATGPDAADCRACHSGGKPEISSWNKIEFNKSLHFIHESSAQIKGTVSSEKDNCSRCHHKYNEKTKDIFYIKGEEESCAYCHKETQQDDIRPIRDASHDACVKCHQSLKGQAIAAGPVTCDGCHDAEKQQKIKKLADVPRLKRNQPDETAITGWKADTQDVKNFMKAVPFNHKSHEKMSESCKACHHETLKKCKECHGTAGGDVKGGFVSLEQAMHKQGSDRSCIGCHGKATENIDCAGCHFLQKGGKENQESCKTCHSLSPEQLKSSDPVQLAKTALSDLSSKYTKVETEKIPEIITIEVLSKDYKPSQFPHRKMVQAIFQRAEKSEMAKVFHTDQAGLCMGCHHNSPKSLEPPKCASCHSKNGPDQDGRPGLKGAYHGQCITCHQKMKVEAVVATDCVKCHEKKK
ncbi:MAG: hypothetical protein A3J80_11040 [Desulfobacula sp. RIFOXYB2_FULL_45_6]|nr:MAG: hypothetical protein A3J80_11040 [Desulfobacula sp. RIFOXYB2_FULL_45_6]